MADVERRERLTQWGRSAAESGQARYRKARSEHAVVAYAEDLYRTDAEANGSVLGSAVALRLFLFIVPATTVIVALVNLLGLRTLFQEHLEASVTTGEIAVAIDGVSWGTSLWIAITGLLLTLWAGHSLVRTLSASNGACWELTSREAKPNVMSYAAVTGVMFAAISVASLFSRLRNWEGVGVAVASWGVAIAVYTVVWFAVTLALPRPSPDPGSLLPGALVFGLGNSALQWFLQYYLPNRIERGTDRYGSMAITIATLGTFFFVGRLMTASFAINAVTYRDFGSISTVVFSVPGLSWLARRFPRLRNFFGLELEDRPGRRPKVVSAPLPDAGLESAEEHLGSDADDEQVDGHLGDDGTTRLLPDGGDVAEPDGGERGDGEVHRVELGLEPDELVAMPVDGEVDPGEAEDGDRQQQHERFDRDDAGVLRIVDGPHP